MNIIEVKNIDIKYNDFYVIKDLSFNIEQGDYLCIVGENGSGKTTLLKALLGLIKIDNGNIIFNNSKNNIGYLPQLNTIKKDFPATVEEIVLSGCLNKLANKFKYSKKEKDLAKDNMEKLNIYSLRNKSYIELSGGQRQKVLLARALCASKEILFLDEPTNSLDIDSSKEFYKTIKQLNNDGLTIVMVTHDIKEINKYCKHILEINEDYFFGTINDYLKKKGDLYA